MEYLEIAYGTVANRGRIIHKSALVSEMHRARLNGQELYKSLFLYDEEINEHMKIRKSVRGFTGKYYLDRLLFDIDKKTDTDEFVLRRVQEFMMRLQEDWKLDQELISPWFSGRGWHIEIPDIFHFEPSNFMPKEVASTFEQYFPEVDDIYDNARIIRVGYTINDKSKRFKVPFTYDEVMATNDPKYFLDIAEKGDFRNRKRNADNSPHDLDYSGMIVKEKAERVKESIKDSPTGIVTCVQEMYNRGPKTGRRHNTMLRMISSMRRQGTPKGVVLAGMLDWGKGMEPYEVQKLVENIYNSPIRYGCGDPIMMDHCSPRCVFFQNKDYVLDVMDANSMQKNLFKFYQTDFAKSAFDLNEVWEVGSPYWVFPGETVMLYGDTGLGKSAALMTMLVKLKRMQILNLQLENHEQLVTRRLIQIDKQMTKSEVMEYFQKWDGKDEGLVDGIQHIKSLMIGPEITMIRKLIADGNYSIVAIDPIDQLKVKGVSDPNYKIEQIVVSLKEIAKAMNVIIIGVHHLSKRSAEDEKGKPKRLTVHSGKGASAIEQKADKVIGIEGDRDGSIRRVASLKARDEETFEAQLIYDKRTLTYRNIQREENGKTNNNDSRIAAAFADANAEIEGCLGTDLSGE